MPGGEVRAGRQEGLWCGGGTTRGMHGEKARVKAWGPRARAERTLNMKRMVVTLEVSKLSGWLKADAPCRVEGEGTRCRGEEVRAGRQEGLWCGGGTTRGMHGEKARVKAWGPRARAERTQNMSLMSVTLEVSKLSGWLKSDIFCRVEGRACDAGGEVRAGSREGLECGGGTQDACTGKARLKAWGGQGHARSAQRTWSSCL